MFSAAPRHDTGGTSEGRTPSILQVVQLRFAEELTHREIARRLGVPKAEAARTLRSAIGRLTAAATAEAPSSALRPIAA
jgi:DNA-directed RNA polymerase specialized sigma24 family protein